MKDIDKLKGKSEQERTSLTISKHVKARLDKVGRINQSYGDLIEQLLDYYEKGEGGKK